jgi:protein-S-isoprenylcysteine O-methyltransferase Ste14
MQMRRRTLPDLGPRGEGWVAGQVLLLSANGILGLLALPATWGSTGYLRGIQVVAGALLMLVGFASAVLGVRDLGPNLTATPRPRAGAQLVSHGIYTRLRHPIYAGLMEGAIGWAGFTGSPLAFLAAVALAVWLDLKARREERWLEEHYAGYTEYRARTHRFVPGVY